MRNRPLLAWLIYASLTLPIGLFGHVLFEQVGGVIRRIGSVEADHAILAACGLALFAAAVAALRHGSHAERRRRLALIQAALPSGTRLVAAGAAMQALVALGSLAVEGVAVDPARAVLALGAGLAAVILGTLVFGAVDDDVLAFVAAIVVVATHRSDLPAARYAADIVPSREHRVARLHAGRAPPFTSSARY